VKADHTSLAEELGSPKGPPLGLVVAPPYVMNIQEEQNMGLEKKGKWVIW
jgi:hypothetical protein